MIHPLLNPNSKHYDTSTRASIYDFEETVTAKEMINICNFEMFKYKSRLGKKEIVVNGEITQTKEQVKESDLKKIDMWEKYKILLQRIENLYINTSVRVAFDTEYPNLKYVL